MKKIFAIVAAACVMAACIGKSDKRTDAATQAPEQVLQVDELLAAADSLSGQAVTVEGICTHISHNGTRIYLMGSDDTNAIDVKATPLSGDFINDCKDRAVKVSGKLVEERIREQDFDRLKAEVISLEADSLSEEDAQELSEKYDYRKETLRARIIQREASEGKDYLSLYYVEAESYEIL